MPAKKETKQTKKSIINLDMQVEKTYSYVNYYNHESIFKVLQCSHTNKESLENVTISIRDSKNCILPYSQSFEELPAENTIKIKSMDILSPVFLAELTKPTKTKITATVNVNNKQVLTEEAEVEILPYTYWTAKQNKLENLACFVRSNLPDCTKILELASEQLQKWGMECTYKGYAEGGKNDIVKIAAAIYSTLHRLQIEEEENLEKQYYNLQNATQILKGKKANKLELAILFASCLEKAGLNPVIVIGAERIACGVWLCDTCSINTVIDEMQELQKHMIDGITDISLIDIDDLFQGSVVNFQTAIEYCMEHLKNGEYKCGIDIKRCRMAGIPAMPIKAVGVKGVTLLEDKQTNLDVAPKTIYEREKLSLEGKVSKNGQWERRLLDLTMKNPLLNFAVERKAIQIISNQIAAVYQAFHKEVELQLLQCLPDFKSKPVRAFGQTADNSILQELVQIELNNGNLHCYLPEAEMKERLQNLNKKVKLAEEEMGTNILYIAFGFLKWYSKNDLDKEPKYAPLILCPVKINRARGGKAYSISLAQEEMHFNQTLLEFLLREFHIDIRGLENILAEKTMVEVLNIVRAEFISMKGWGVEENIYLSTFLFSRFAMWNDIHQNIEKFKTNKIVDALLHNKSFLEDNLPTQNLPMDSYAITDILTPLPADSYQFSAVAEAVAGRSLVLHGPPGTGKSQTITNLIANCLNKGKRVLFVAEKQAALDVVKKRLDEAKLGDFCLELHSNKCGKGELLKRLENTYNLASTAVEIDLTTLAAQIENLRVALNEPSAELHKKRRMGISVYEGILRFLKNKNAKDILNIESTFYDQLTAEKLIKYENMLTELSAVATECGGIYHSPFENINLTEIDLMLKKQIYYAGQIVLVENKNIRQFLNFTLEFFNHKVTVFTEKKLLALMQLVQLLQTEKVQSYFNCVEEEFYIFFNANKQLDRALTQYLEKYRQIVALPYPIEDIEEEYKRCGVNIKGNKKVKALLKALKKNAITATELEGYLMDIPLVLDIYRQIAIIRTNTNLSDHFYDKNGELNLMARVDYLETLNLLHTVARELFIDFNVDSFNSVCIQAVQGGYLGKALKAIENATKNYYEAYINFSNLVALDTTKIYDTDIIEYYGVKTATLLENIDMLSQWTMYKKLSKQFANEGLGFVGETLESGLVTAEELVYSFRKNVYKYFVESNIALNPVLSNFSVPVFERKIEQYRIAEKEFIELSKKYIRNRLIQQLPSINTEGDLSVEVLNFQRILKSKMRGMTIKDFFASCEALVARLCPCMLMSPNTVAQYLPAKADMFDIVIFDEASQLPTSEAIGSIARAKNAIIVGDPKQLPPTSFFNSNYVDEENMELEDLENILDDCLALNLPEKHLLWHYRSKHESLIAFSNLMYYDGKLCTYPSPDALSSKVKMHFIENGIYDRGHAKNNKEEAKALIAEVMRRLKDKKLSKRSIGIVTFSTPQRDYIEKHLTEAIAQNGLEEVAYDREEAIFVKNLENVQGDERDVILFSTCYGADKYGKFSMNFGPLNQSGGWRRLNVAASRAREEMIIFSSMTSAMINLERTNAKGVQGLKTLLEFAEKGKMTLPFSGENIARMRSGIGKHIAKSLETYGYECRYNIGASNFKIDCAVLDPKNPSKFILAILCDSELSQSSSAYDRNILQPAMLKASSWREYRVYTVSYINNPSREIKNIKSILDELVNKDANLSMLEKYRTLYKKADLEEIELSSEDILEGDMDAKLIDRIHKIVFSEEPIETNLLIKRLLASVGIEKITNQLKEKVLQLILASNLKNDKVLDKIYWYKHEKSIAYTYYRTNEENKSKSAEEISVYEVITLAKALLESNVSLYLDELLREIGKEFKVSKMTEKVQEYFTNCISLATKKGIFMQSSLDKITLA